jgi:hypothetical protein
MTYYAKFNLYGSTTDTGFANTWQVAGFASKAARDAWVNDVNPDRVDIEAVTRAEAEKLVDASNRARAARGGELADVIYLTDDNKTFVRAY